MTITSQKLIIELGHNLIKQLLYYGLIRVTTSGTFKGNSISVIADSRICAKYFLKTFTFCDVCFCEHVVYICVEFLIHLSTRMDTFYRAFPEFTLEKYYPKTLTTKKKEIQLHFRQQMSPCFKNEHRVSADSFFFLIKLFICLFLFLAVLGRRCCLQAFSSCGERGLLFVAVCGLLTVLASLVADHGLQACRLQQLWHLGSVVVACGHQSAGSVVVVHRLSCSLTCGIFPGQGLNPCPLHWQEDS